MTLLLACSAAALLHALAPDHWLPFAALAKAGRWSLRKTLWVTALAGVIHVFFSFLLGMIGLELGRSLERLLVWEEFRGNLFSFLLIGFGLALLIRGAKQANARRLGDGAGAETTKSYWAYFLVFVLGPCEPLIPFMFLADGQGGGQIALVTAVFGIATLAAMLTAVAAVLRLSSHPFFLRFSSLNRTAGAGAAMAATGLMVRGLGL